MQGLLQVNIHQFERELDYESYLSDDGEFDTDRLIADVEDNPQAGAPDSEAPPESEENTETPDESAAGEEQEQENEQAEEAPDAADTQEQKRTPDQAFAELRREAEQNRKYAEFLTELSKKQGLQSPDELMTAWEERQAQQAAQEQNIPVDVYKRLQTLEKENQQKSQEAFAERFDREVEETVNQYGLKDEDVESVFRYMGENGYINPDNTTSIPFQDAYVLANKDTLFQQAEERGRQALLEAEKQKQESAAVNTGTGKAATGGELDMSEEGILNQLSALGIDID